MEDLVAYFDGEFMPQSEIHMPIDNLGFTRGYGAYECTRTWGLKPFHLDDHIERLRYSCSQLHLKVPEVNFESIIELLMKKNPETDLIFRIYVTDHPHYDGSILTILCNTPQFHYSNMPSPYYLKTIIDKRPYFFKSTNYASGLIETKKAKDEGYNGILYVGEDGGVHELARANIFAVKNMTLYTPKNFCLPGITRKEILTHADRYGYQTSEDDFSLDFLKDAEEVFATASIRAITPIAQIDQMHFDSQHHCKRLQEHFEARLNLSVS